MEQLLKTSERKEGFQVYTSRWLMLIIFMFLSFNQSLFWLTFSPISVYSREYFDLCDPHLNSSYYSSCSRVNGKGQDSIDLMLAWGGIIYLISVPIYIFYTFDKGLRTLLLFMSTLLVIGCVLRVIPKTFLLNNIDENYNLYIVHVAQIIFALTGPIAMATPPRLSAIWFAPSERFMATALSSSSAFLGLAAGFATSTQMVRSEKDIPNLLWTHLFLSGASFIVVILLFRDSPPLPPSATAPTTTVRRGRSDSNLDTRWKDFCHCFSDVNFGLLAFSGGMCVGVFNGWSASLDSILTFFSAIECGWLGVSTTCAFIFGNLFGGQIGERIAFTRSIQKEIIVFFLFDLLLFLLALTFSLSFFGYEPLLPRTFDFVCLTITFAGFFLGSANPFLYELSVEMTYPISENVSAGVLTFWINFGKMAILIIKRFIRADAMNSVMSCTVIFGLILIFFMTPKYNRLNEEREEKERQKMIPGLDSNRLYIGQTVQNTYGSIDETEGKLLNTSDGSNDFNVDFE